MPTTPLTVRPAKWELRRRNAAAAGSLAAICPEGHALTKAQVERGGPCPLCVAQAPALSYP